MARQETNRLLEMIDEGILDPKAVVTMCVKYTVSYTHLTLPTTPYV